jgi:hypothetical protein
MGQTDGVVEIRCGVFTGGDVAGQRAIHCRHVDRSGRQRVRRVVDALTFTVEADGEPTRLEAVWIAAGQQESSVGPDDFEGLARLVVATAASCTFSRLRSAGMWESLAQPRFGLAPMTPLRLGSRLRLRRQHRGKPATDPGTGGWDFSPRDRWQSHLGMCGHRPRRDALCAELARPFRVPADHRRRRKPVAIPIRVVTWQHRSLQCPRTVAASKG